MKLKHILAAFALGFAPSLASAQALQDFAINNQTGYDIAQVFVSSAQTADWEEDVLGADILPDDGTMTISFRGQPKICDFDLKVVYSDGEEAIWTSFDLCEISTVSLFYDRKSGKTWASTE